MDIITMPLQKFNIHGFYITPYFVTLQDQLINTYYMCELNVTTTTPSTLACTPYILCFFNFFSYGIPNFTKLIQMPRPKMRVNGCRIQKLSDENRRHMESTYQQLKAPFISKVRILEVNSPRGSHSENNSGPCSSPNLPCNLGQGSVASGFSHVSLNAVLDGYHWCR